HCTYPKNECIVRKFSILLIAAVVVFTGTGCLKNETCSPKSVSSEAPAIQAYAQTNGIAAVPHTSGLYYEILDPGSGDAPDDNSTIYIRYTGKLLDGTVFDQKTNAAETGWILGGLIEDRKSTRLNSSHVKISYAVFCLKKKKKHTYK